MLYRAESGLPSRSAKFRRNWKVGASRPGVLPRLCSSILRVGWHVGVGAQGRGTGRTSIERYCSPLAWGTLADVIRASRYPQLLCCVYYGPAPWPTEETSSREG